MKPISADSRLTLSRNLAALMKQREMDQHAVARAAGVSQKTVSNILRMEGSPRICSVEAVAGAFGLKGWQLLASPEVVDGLDELLAAWGSVSSEGREMIVKVAEREVAYSRQRS